MAGGGTTARGFLISLGAAFLLLLWDAGELVRLQWYVQSKVSIVSNRGAHFTSCGSKNPLLQGFSRSEEHTSELQSHSDLVCRLLLEKKKNTISVTSVPPSVANMPRRASSGSNAAQESS